MFPGEEEVEEIPALNGEWEEVTYNPLDPKIL